MNPIYLYILMTMIVIALVGLTLALGKDEYHPKLTILNYWDEWAYYVRHMDCINLINWLLIILMCITYTWVLGFCYLFIVPFYKQEKK